MNRLRLHRFSRHTFLAAAVLLAGCGGMPTQESAPSADAAHYTVPYFVAVTQGDNLIEKRILQISFDFAAGDSIATFSESPDDFDIHVENGHQTFEYQLMAGFQMTPAQVDYNKKMGRYTP